MPKESHSFLKMNTIQRIALILVVVFLIPVLFFTAYELTSLNRNEAMIEEIYQKQLEAILFSVNQYSDDAVNSWMTKAEAGFTRLESDSSSLKNLLSLTPAIRLIFLTEGVDPITDVHLISPDPLVKDSLKRPLETILNQHTPLIQKLIQYKSTGFQKTMVVPDSSNTVWGYTTLLFITSDSDQELRVAGFVIDADLFVEDLMGPRLQSIAKDQFILSVFKGNNRLYSTLMFDSTTQFSAALTKDLWVFPDYKIGIRTEGTSLQQLVRERTYTNLYLLTGLNVVLVLALVLTFRSVKKEVQLAQNKADFVSNVSHEIRTPLSLISMFAETLELGRAKSEEKKQEYYSIISKEAHRLTGIVNTILNFSQTEAGKKTLHPAPLDLTREVKEVLRTYDYHLRSKGFDFTFEGPEGITVWADQQALTEIIINLIDNAIKYSRDKKQIEISTGREATRGWLAVRDLGIGISANDQKHIFDKFYRVSTGNLAKSPGTGLGLSLVKQLIEQQNGTISVKSELGTGSTFKVYFPLHT